MRRRVRGCGVVACAVWLAAASGLVRAASVISWQAAGAYQGEIVTVEGDVARARLEADTVVLEFAPDDPRAFRAVLLVPLITDLPRQPQRLYQGKRVRVSGKIRSWQGRPEMIVRGPDAIEVVGVAAAPAEGAAPLPAATPTTSPPPPTAAPAPLSPPTTLPPAPPATSPPAPLRTTAPPDTRAPAAPPTLPPTTLPPVVRPTPPTTTPAAVAPPPPATPEPEQDEPPRLPQRVDPCVAARERWRRAAADAEARAAALGRCLRAVDYRCRPAAAALAPALSELEWAEQQVEAACP